MRAEHSRGGRSCQQQADQWSEPDCWAMQSIGPKPAEQPGIAAADPHRATNSKNDSSCGGQLDYCTPHSGDDRLAKIAEAAVVLPLLQLLRQWCCPDHFKGTKLA